MTKRSMQKDNRESFDKTDDDWTVYNNKMSLNQLDDDKAFEILKFWIRGDAIEELEFLSVNFETGERVEVWSDFKFDIQPSSKIRVKLKVCQ